MDEKRQNRILQLVTDHYERNHAAHEARARRAGFDDWEAEINLSHLLLSVKHFNFSCCYCGTPLDECEITFEHPLLIEDGNTNIVVCCRSCNSSHGNRPLYTWLESRGFSSADFSQTMFDIALEIREELLQQIEALESRETGQEKALRHMADRAESFLT